MVVDAWVDNRASNQPTSLSSYDKGTNEEGYEIPNPAMSITSDEEIDDEVRYEQGNQTLKAALELWTSLGLAMETSILEEFEEGISILKNALHRHEQRVKTAMRESSYVDLDPSEEEEEGM
ncbi:hypothetical protein CPB86DRAFT_785916 [Serendipita vermifera]|nr:hypothetical protein CPB86DRAFT_785916 [Serendipita vermifera]